MECNAVTSAVLCNPCGVTFITRSSTTPLSSQEYIVNGEEHMRVIFYVSGSKRKGTAHMDLKKVLNN